jgi:DNA-binding response OmpR family regulator
VVDDQPIVGAAIQGMLAREPGMSVHYCAEAARALEVARALRPAVIVQDLRMPEVDGLDLIERFRADPATAGVPILVLTSQDDAESMTSAFALGADDYLVKIPDKLALIERIERLARAPGPHRAARATFAEATVMEWTLASDGARVRLAPPGAPAPPTGAGGETIELSLPIQDLSGERALAELPTCELVGRTVPALGGIALLAKLGQGGAGAVYYGLHPRLACEVAVKVLPQELADNPRRVDRFYREARLAARIDSPHLVRVLDVDEEAGTFFLVMEYVRGVTAHELWQRRRAAGAVGLGEREALELGRAIALGLAVAHREGVVHRDVKPTNVLVPAGADGEPRAGRAKLADLGIARSEVGGDGLTLEDSVLGTPGFMAPEQARDPRGVAPAADVFGLGATLYMLLSGAPPFPGESALASALASLERPLPPLALRRGDLTAVSRAVVERALARRPEERFRDGEALAAAFALALEAEADRSLPADAALARLAAL